MKFAIGISIICCFCYIGFTIRSQLSERHKFYKDVLNLINQFMVNLNFYKNSVEDFLENYKTDSELKKIIEYYISSKFKGEEALLNVKYITKEEVNMVLNCFNQLGGTDSENQETLLKGFENDVLNLCNETKEELSKYGTMAFKLSAIVGLLTVILLI